MSGEFETHDGLARFSVHALDEGSHESLSSVTHRPRPGIAPENAAVLDSETAARGYLDHALGNPDIPALAGPVAGGDASRFTTISSETVPLTGTRTVKFRQTLHGIPVYGSFVVVELDEGNELVGIDTTLGRPEDVDPVARISPARAVEVVREAPGDYEPLLMRVVPRLNFWFDQELEGWRLVYLLQDVPVTTNGTGTKGADGPESPHLVDYVVDAHDGSIVAVLPRTPSLTAPGQEQTAEDSYGVERTFLAEADGDRLVLRDPVHNVATFDFGFSDPVVGADQLPGTIIAKPPDWAAAAVSAHANAVAVSDFLRAVVLRDNIDDRGGVMTSSINCVVQDASTGPKQWANAFWNGRQMVYGQVAHGDQLRSLSANVDVVGHEIFHGVTDRTSRLEYRMQSGALNESFSDIFGTIIANRGTEDTRTWDWLIGEDLLPSREAFRSLADPARFGQPAHMDDYQDLPNTQQGDWGGVHTNSGIPNKAAFILLTSEDPDGSLTLAVREVAAIFYLTLTQRLSRTSQFVDSRRAAIASARTLFRRLPADERDRKVAAVGASFDAVGIVG